MQKNALFLFILRFYISSCISYRIRCRCISLLIFNPWHVRLEVKNVFGIEFIFKLKMLIKSSFNTNEINVIMFCFGSLIEVVMNYINLVCCLKLSWIQVNLCFPYWNIPRPLFKTHTHTHFVSFAFVCFMVFEPLHQFSIMKLRQVQHHNLFQILSGHLWLNS